MTKKDKKVYCVITGEELLKSSNGNGASKDRKKRDILQKAMCQINCLLNSMDSADDISQKKADIKAVIKNARAAVKEVDQENSNERHENDCSFHHPAKKAVFGPNDFVLPMKRSLHSALDNNNISLLENIILGPFFPEFMAVNAAFINNGGQNLPRTFLVDRAIEGFMIIRGLSEKDLRRKLMRGVSDPAGRARNMLTARGVVLPRKGQY